MTRLALTAAALAACGPLLAAPALAAPVTLTLSGTATDGAVAGEAFTATFVFDDAADDTRRDETDATEFFGAILDFTLTVAGDTVTFAGTDETRNFTQQDADGLTLSGALGGTQDGQDALAGAIGGDEALGVSFALTGMGAGLLYDDQDALLSGVVAEMAMASDFADLALTLDLVGGGVTFAVDALSFGGEVADAVPLPGAALFVMTGMATGMAAGMAGLGALRRAPR